MAELEFEARQSVSRVAIESLLLYSFILKKSTPCGFHMVAWVLILAGTVQSKFINTGLICKYLKTMITSFLVPKHLAKLSGSSSTLDLSLPPRKAQSVLYSLLSISRYL